MHTKYDAPDMEKFLYDLNRYLYRQHLRHAQQPDEQPEEAEDDASSELSRLTHRDADAMANGATTKHRYQRRLSWPFWAAKAAARASEGGPASRADALSRPYEKRNSELINSLLGLPRVMKVVG